MAYRKSKPRQLFKKCQFCEEGQSPNYKNTKGKKEEVIHFKPSGKEKNKK